MYLYYVRVRNKWRSKNKINPSPDAKCVPHTKSKFSSFQRCHKMTCIRWRKHFRVDMDSDGSNNHLETLLFPVWCLFWDETEKREERREKRQEGKNNFPFWRAEWLCVGELAVHTKMKRKCHSFEILQSKLTFYLSYCQRKAEERWESKREMERRERRGKRKRHRWGRGALG